MVVPTEEELQQLYDQAQLHSDWAKSDPHNASVQDLADEQWQQFHSALAVYRETVGDQDWRPIVGPVSKLEV